MTENEIFEIAPCLENGPFCHDGLNFVKKALEIPKSIIGDIIKTWATYYIFIAKETAFKKQEEPTNEIISNFKKQEEFIDAFNKLNHGLFFTTGIVDNNRKSIREVEKETGIHYGNLFKDFNQENYFGEAVELLRTRLEVNNIYPENLGNKTVLDAGCGGGRYSAAWKKLGAKKVVGVDFSEIGVENAKDRIKGTDIIVEYKQEDVLDMSFKDNSFDIVFSNGVLHHTRDLKKGISELIRVLKPNGMGWLYLIEKPGGYFWDIIEILRVIMKDVDNGIARDALKALNVPTNRIFYILDHIMVPVNMRLNNDEIVNLLLKNGAKNIERLKRGYCFDRIEKIYNKEPFAEMKFGVGENRYVFSK